MSHVYSLTCDPIKIKCFPPRILDYTDACVYSCLQLQPKENWFHYVRREYATVVKIPYIWRRQAASVASAG